MWTFQKVVHLAASQPLSTFTIGVLGLQHEAPWFIPLVAFSVAGVLYSDLLDKSARLGNA